MIGFLLLFVGIFLYRRQRADFAALRIQAEGAGVRTAGMILMLPFFTDILLGIYVGFTVESPQAVMRALTSYASLQAGVIVFALLMAYIILKRSTNTVSSPAYPSTQPGSPSFSMPTQANFPSVMTTQEAARYLNVPEERIIDAIYKGELAAAHINNRYNISRRVLDEFRETLKNG